MIRPIRFLALAIVTAAIGLAGGVAEARTHHHRHHAAAPAVVCDRHHRHCHPAKKAASAEPRRSATATIGTAMPAAAASATAQVCDRHHRHCHPAQTMPGKVVCGRHHRHCHAVGPAPKVVCGRHHRHCHAVVEATHHRRHAATVAAAAPDTPAAGDNGMCKSVRIHGEWVQRCHFPGQ